jgi:hypothetical protein
VRTYVFDASPDTPGVDDGVQVLVTIFEATPDNPDPNVDVALRPYQGATWGPPLDLAERG